MSRELTVKQRAFLKAFLHGPAALDGVASATVAGYAYPAQAAHQLIQKPHIRHAIAEWFHEDGAMAAALALRSLSDVAYGRIPGVSTAKRLRALKLSAVIVGLP